MFAHNIPTKKCELPLLVPKMCVCVCVGVCVCVCVCVNMGEVPERGTGSLKAAVTSGCEMSGTMSASNQTPILFEKSKHSSTKPSL